MMLVLGFTSSTFAQTNDKVIKVKGDTLNVLIQSINDDAIVYKYPNENVTQTINKNIVKQIIYSSGRIENITTPISINGEKDWEKVVLTTNPKDVEGLTNLGELQGLGKSGTGGEQQTRPKAEKDIKTQAAQKGAFIIFVKSQNFSISWSNQYIITGTAYGY